MRYNQWALTTEKDPVLRDFGHRFGNSGQRRLPKIVHVLGLAGNVSQHLRLQASFLGLVRDLADRGLRHALPKIRRVLYVMTTNEP